MIPTNEDARHEAKAGAHTPTPWMHFDSREGRISGAKPGIDVGHIIASEANSAVLAIGAESVDAAFIVEACNQHDINKKWMHEAALALAKAETERRALKAENAKLKAAINSAGEDARLILDGCEGPDCRVTSRRIVKTLTAALGGAK